MSIKQRNQVKSFGNGTKSIVYAHGFGCDQNMWRYLTPSFQDGRRTVLFDHVGSGSSDLKAYDFDKYDKLDGYADDLLEIIDEFASGPVIFVGHSVSAMIGVLAEQKAPDRFAAHVMVAPSPCYINDGEYKGGFSREDIDGLLNILENNYLGWSSTMAPTIMGAPDRPEHGVELTNSFCRTDPEIAKHFARVTFLSDHRSLLPNVKSPSLILQCSEDIIAPVTVGEYMQKTMPKATLRVIDNVGHCPHLSAPDQSSQAMRDFLDAINA